MELEFERFKSQALNHRALILIERWHGVETIIQQKKEGETWLGEGQRWARPPNSGNSEGMDQVSVCSPTGFSQQ